MRNAKKYLVGLTSAAMVLGTIATGASVSAQTAGSPPFSDISGVTQAPAITFLATAGIVNGVSTGLFDPTGTVTRAEMAKIVVNLIGKGNVASALNNETPSFADASSIPTWAWGYVNVAADMGIVNGFPNGDFEPNAPVTDVQVAAMLVRAIGDQSQVVGTWPGNYVAEAFNLGLNKNISNWVAGLPASRADAAQMAYNAAVDAPAGYATTSTTLNNITTSTTTPNAPLFMSAGGVSGNQVYRGVVTGVSNQNISLQVLANSSQDTYGPYQGTTITIPFASSYQLAGSLSSLSNLVGQTVVAMASSAGSASGQYGQIDYLKLSSTSSVTQHTGVLGSTASGSLVPALPTGYITVSAAGTSYPWLATNNPECASVSSLSTLGASPCDTSLFLLLGTSGSSSTTPGTTVPLATYNSVAGSSVYYINAPSSGVSSDPTAEVAGVTNLNEGATVSYTTSASGDLAALYETNTTYSVGVVSDTHCASGCTNSTSGVPWITFTLNGATYRVAVQPYTTLDVNGASATLSSSLVNDAIYASVVGNGNNPSFNNTAENAAAPGPNATQLLLFQNQVTGTVTGFTVSTSAHGNGPNNFYANGSTTATATTTSEGYSSITLSLTNGSTQTYATDSNFNPNGQISTGQSVTLVIDNSGDARKVINTVSANVVAAPALIVGESQTQSLNSLTPNQVQLTVADAAGTSESLTMPPLNGAALPTVFNGSDVSPFVTETGSVAGSTYQNYQAPTSTQGPGNPMGAILFVTNSQGQAVNANGLGTLAQVEASSTPPDGLPLQNVTGAVYYVAEASNGTAILGSDTVTNNGTSGYTLTNNSAVSTILSSGEAFYNNGGTWTAESLGSLSVGHIVDVYQGTYLGQTYYIVIDTGVSGTTTSMTAGALS